MQNAYTRWQQYYEFFSSLFVNTARDVNLFRWQRVQHVYTLLLTESLAARTIARGYLRCFMLMTYNTWAKSVCFKFSCQLKAEKMFLWSQRKKADSFRLNKKTVNSDWKFNFLFSASHFEETSFLAQIKIEPFFQADISNPKRWKVSQ